MKFKLALSLMLACAFCLQASARNQDDDAATTLINSNTAFDYVIQEPESLNKVNASASDSGLDVEDIAEIDRIRGLENKDVISDFYSDIWKRCVEQVLKMAEGTLNLPNDTVSESTKNCLFSFFIHYETTPELDKIFDLNLREYREQGLSEKEIRKKALESAQYFAEIINNNPTL
jgi:hypothetical protein